MIVSSGTLMVKSFLTSLLFSKNLDYFKALFHKIIFLETNLVNIKILLENTVHYVPPPKS